MEVTLGDLGYRTMFRLWITRRALVFEAPLLGGVCYHLPRRTPHTFQNGEVCGRLGLLVWTTPAMFRAEHEKFLTTCDAEGDMKVRTFCESKPRWSFFWPCDECGASRLHGYADWR